MSLRESLFRQHQWQLEERRQFLAGLEGLAARLRGDAQRLEHEIAEHRPADEGDVSSLLRPLVERRRRIERSITEVDARIAEARALVTEATQEVERSAAAVRMQPQRIPGRVGRPPQRGLPHAVRRRPRQRSG
jgi:hypothetical protein